MENNTKNRANLSSGYLFTNGLLKLGQKLRGQEWQVV